VKASKILSTKNACNPQFGPSKLPPHLTTRCTSEGCVGQLITGWQPRGRQDPINLPNDPSRPNKMNCHGGGEREGDTTTTRWHEGRGGGFHALSKKLLEKSGWNQVPKGTDKKFSRKSWIFLSLCVDKRGGPWTRLFLPQPSSTSHWIPTISTRANILDWKIR